MIIQSVFPAVERIFRESGGVMEEGTVTCFCLLKYMFLQQRYMCGIGDSVCSWNRRRCLFSDE